MVEPMLKAAMYPFLLVCISFHQVSGDKKITIVLRVLVNLNQNVILKY